jgi:ATP-dependent helicase/DNAse subunit B
MLRDPLGFAWRYALGYRLALEEEQPLTVDRRSFGEIVHLLLKRAVDWLEPEPGYLRAAKHEIEESLDRAVAEVFLSWPLDHATPPEQLWRHLLEEARRLSLRALTLDEGFRPGTRSWTEVRFGDEDARGGPDLPWDPKLPVRLGDSRLPVRGSIDRLDMNVDGHLRVSDYKTGVEPKKAARMVLAGGAELQRAIYASAARQLLGGERRIVTRLLYLGEEAPNPYVLNDLDTVFVELASVLKKGRAIVEAGTTLPGPDAWERWNDARLAQPASLASYRRIKQSAIAKAFGDFARVWSTP